MDCLIPAAGIQILRDNWIVESLLMNTIIKRQLDCLIRAAGIQS